MAGTTSADLTPEELKQQKLAAMKAAAMAPYSGGEFTTPLPQAAPATVVNKPVLPGKTPGGGYDVRKALMDKALARYLPRTV